MTKFTREDFELRAELLEKRKHFLFEIVMDTSNAHIVDLAALRIAARTMDRERIARLVTDEGNPGGDVGPYQYAFADALIAMLKGERDE